MDITNNALFGTVAGGIILAILGAVYKKVIKKNLDDIPSQNVEIINDREDVSKEIKEISLSETEKLLYKELAELFLFAEKKSAYFLAIYNQHDYGDHFYTFRDDIFTKCQDLRKKCKISSDISDDFSESFLTTLGAIYNTEKLAPNGGLKKDYEISLYNSTIKQAFNNFENKFRKQ